jgi:hypothetical protein
MQHPHRHKAVSPAFSLRFVRFRLKEDQGQDLQGRPLQQFRERPREVRVKGAALVSMLMELRTRNAKRQGQVALRPQAASCPHQIQELVSRHCRAAMLRK